MCVAVRGQVILAFYTSFNLRYSVIMAQETKISASVQNVSTDPDTGDLRLFLMSPFMVKLHAQHRLSYWSSSVRKIKQGNHSLIEIKTVYSQQ